MYGTTAFHSYLGIFPGSGDGHGNSDALKRLIIPLVVVAVAIALLILAHARFIGIETLAPTTSAYAERPNSCQ